jgi:hypothetical protein
MLGVAAMGNESGIPHRNASRDRASAKHTVGNPFLP